MADTIREFLVGIGFKVDQSSERQFTSAMEGAVLRANLLATAIEAMARTVASIRSAKSRIISSSYFTNHRASGLRLQGFKLLSLHLSNSAAALGTLTPHWKVSDISSGLNLGLKAGLAGWASPRATRTASFGRHRR